MAFIEPRIPWCSPTTSTRGSATINNAHNGDQYIQFRATFKQGYDFTNTPVLDKVKFTYRLSLLPAPASGIDQRQTANLVWAQRVVVDSLLINEPVKVPFLAA